MQNLIHRESYRKWNFQPITVGYCLSQRSLRVDVSQLCLQGDDLVEYFLAVKPSGVAVYKNKTKVGSYNW